MSSPRQPGEYPPLRIAGYGLLVIAAIAAIVGLVSLAGGGSDANPDRAVAQSGPSAEALPPDPAAAPAPPAPTAGAPAEPAPAGPAEPAPAAPPAAPPAGPMTPLAPPPAATPALPGAGLPSDDSTRSGGGKMGGSASAARAPVRVYNNSLITGLADRAADDMRGSGWQVTEVGNYPSANIPTSTVYYRPGTDEQAAARSLANSFGLRSLPRFEGIANAHPGLIVIVTKDYQRR